MSGTSLQPAYYQWVNYFYSKWFLKLIKQILDVSCYIQKLLREGILVQSHFNLSMSATQAQHLFGVISEPIGHQKKSSYIEDLCLLESNWRDLQHYSAPSFWVQTPGGTTRKWKIEGMKSLVVQFLLLFFLKLMHLMTNRLILLTIYTIRSSKCDCNICLEKYGRLFDHIWQAAGGT